MHSESEDLVGGFRPGTYVGGFRIPTRAEIDLSMEKYDAERKRIAVRKEKAWRRKLKLPIYWRTFPF